MSNLTIRSVCKETETRLAETSQTWMWGQVRVNRLLNEYQFALYHGG